MKLWVALLAMSGLCSGPATAFEERAGELNRATVRAIFRLVVGQPELKDDKITVIMRKAHIWTCVWPREGTEEVTVLEIRDSDGAYRQPDITDLNSLEFGMRLDLKERIEALVRESRKEK